MKTQKKLVALYIITLFIVNHLCPMGRKTINIIPGRELEITFDNFSGEKYTKALKSFYQTLEHNSIPKNESNTFILDKHTPEEIYIACIDLNVAVIKDVLKIETVNNEFRKHMLRSRLNNLLMITQIKKCLPTTTLDYARAWFWDLRKKIDEKLLDKTEHTQNLLRYYSQQKKSFLNALPHNLQKKFDSGTQNKPDPDIYIKSINTGFKCELCKYTAPHKGICRRHVAIQHLKITRYTCNKCNTGFYYQSQLKNHIKVKHSVNVITNSTL